MTLLSFEPPKSRPSQLGAYRIEDLIAQGGAGVVYRAHHEKTERRAAVKVVKAPRESLLQALRREISVLSRIRHPGIAEILDYGIQDGMPFYAMDFVEGPTLRQWAAARRAEPTGLDLPQALSLVASVASTLAFLHGEGLVHRDLKPDNVIVAPGGRPVIVDFGFATRFPGGSNRESILEDEGAAGTVAFMSPELIAGDLVDARTDNYALGCLLYELATGRLPFEGNAREILGAHLGTRPAPISSLVSGIDPKLDALVMRLLEKAPDDRPAYAADVARTLFDLAGRPLRESEGPPARSYLYRSPLVARHDSLVKATLALDELESGRGGMVVLTGSSGIGKTRLAVEIMRMAARRGIRVLAGAALGTATSLGVEPGGAHFQPLVAPLEAIAFRCREWGPDEARRLLAGRAGVLAPFVPALSAIPGLEQEPPPEELKPEAARQRATLAVADALAAFSESAPVLLVLDDLQWADDLTIAFLELALRTKRFEGVPVLCLSAVRHEEMDHRLRSIAEDPAVVRLSLDKLEEGDLSGMIGAMLCVEEPPKALVDHVAPRAQGNPFFVAEYLRHAVNEGALTRDADGHWSLCELPSKKDGSLDALGLPSSIAELMARRLDALSPGARDVAELAAVLGRDVDEETLRDATGASRESVDEALDELRRRSVLEPAAAELSFEHDRLREELYGTLSEERRRALHRAVGETLQEKLAELELDSHRERLYPSLGHHFFEAHVYDPAVEYLDKAAEAAIRVHANHEAISYLRSILAIADSIALEPMRRARFERLLGSALLAVGHLDQSRACHERALKLLGKPFPRSPLTLALGILWGLVVQATRGLTKTSAKPAASPEERKLLVEACRSTEEICYLLSDTLALVYIAFRLVSLADRSGSPGEIARARATFGAMLGIIPLERAAESFLASAASAASRSEDGPSRAWVAMIDAYHAVGKGIWDRAVASANSGYDVAMKCGELRRSEECLSLLCEVESLRGDPAEAIALADRGLSSARARGDRQTELWALCDRGRMLLASGAPDLARESLERASLLVESTMLADRCMASGLLALALARLDEEAIAKENALVAVEAGEKADPSIYHAMHGSVGAVEALCLFAEETPDPAEKKRLLALARRAVRSLGRYRNAFPVARPKYCIAEGRVERASGLVERAARSFENAARFGKELAMKQEVALAERELQKTTGPSTKG